MKNCINCRQMPKVKEFGHFCCKKCRQQWTGDYSPYKNETQQIRCRKCGVKLDLPEKSKKRVCDKCTKLRRKKYRYPRKKEHKEYIQKYNKEFRAQNKQKMDAYKLEKGCQKCGYKKCAAALHFHHENPKEKDISVSRLMNRRWDKILTEVKKCTILCANCHAEIHFQ